MDGDQTAEVAAHLLRLAADPGSRERLEDRAREYARTVMDQRRCAGLYLDVAREVGGSS